jgi:hypothetical protein
VAYDETVLERVPGGTPSVFPSAPVGHRNLSNRLELPVLMGRPYSIYEVECPCGALVSGGTRGICGACRKVYEIRGWGEAPHEVMDYPQVEVTIKKLHGSG